MVGVIFSEAGGRQSRDAGDCFFFGVVGVEESCAPMEETSSSVSVARLFSDGEEGINFFFKVLPTFFDLIILYF